ncbi:MAG: hypothetical protein GXY44_01790 [Phycisphaerales bacterium]|nr:hypothetical protein [Phycisphaerales bacterium]
MIIIAQKIEWSQEPGSGRRVSRITIRGWRGVFLAIVAGVFSPAFAQAQYSQPGHDRASLNTGVTRQGLSREAYLRSTGQKDPTLIKTPLNRVGMASSMDGLGLSRQFSGGYHTWFQPEVVIRRQKIRDHDNTESVDFGPTAEQLCLNEMAVNYMSARMEMYFADGWRYFQDGDYRRAYEMFGLADRATSHNSELRALVKLSQFHAAVAQGQYAMASHALFWLLRPDPATQRLVDPLFLLRINDLPNRYVSREKFEEDVQQIVALARRSAEEVAQARTPGMSDQEHRRMAAIVVSPVRGLAAVMLWYRSRNEGEFYARSHLVGEEVPAPWSQLPDIMKTALEEERRQSGAMASGLLPSLERTDQRMPWRVSSESISSE